MYLDFLSPLLAKPILTHYRITLPFTLESSFKLFLWHLILQIVNDIVPIKIIHKDRVSIFTTKPYRFTHTYCFQHGYRIFLCSILGIIHIVTVDCKVKFLLYITSINSVKSNNIEEFLVVKTIKCGIINFRKREILF